MIRTCRKHSILFVMAALLFSMLVCLLSINTAMAQQRAAAATATLSSPSLKLVWNKNASGWRLQQLFVKHSNQWIRMPGVSGEYTILYAQQKPDSLPATLYDEKGKAISFPEPSYRYVISGWKDATLPVAMNTAGSALRFYPSNLQTGNNELSFTQEADKATITATWRMDPQYAGDVLVHMTLTAKQDGYYSLASPSLAIVEPKDLSWGMVPGHFQGNAIEKNVVKAYAYGQGIPAKPVVARERTASTLSPLITNRQGITMAVVPAPGTARDPWENDHKTQRDWQLGLSLMNRSAALTPTAWHPVLGERGSWLKKGDSVHFSFRYTVRSADWYTVYKHAANDIYRLKDFLSLKQTKQSLTSRTLSMYRYVIDDSTSKWRVESYKDMPIGAQQYMGGVYGSTSDAIKNADYGAMWMLANITHDTILQQTRLPYARNFKRAQQDETPGFFQGAAAGQYYLTAGKRFTEEWGPYVEPIGTTYYMLMDLGNILLFKPTDTVLRKELQAAADRLLAWMDADGKWAVAYDHRTEKQMFTDLEDLRPTFYGLVIAYKLSGDKKYLQAALKGADWFIKNAVNKGHFTGVCGDTRFVPDFATGQSAQALLDLYQLSKDPKHLQAALATARLYTTSVYTHPIPTHQQKTVKGQPREDWEISQVGLSFEHGGSIGSAADRGPILLASHAGMFVRFFTLTHDSLFLTMARAAALGRDAFVDPATSVASYYWDAMNRGSGPFPHHAWWQIGWITDYLLSEVELRTTGQVRFPRGFITPKVGPHQTYGFAAGTIYGHKADLLLKEVMLQTANPYLDYFAAIDTTRKKLFFLLLNNDDGPLHTTVQPDYSKVLDNGTLQPQTIYSIDAGGKRIKLNNTSNWQLTIPAYGIQTIEISF